MVKVFSLDSDSIQSGGKEVDVYQITLRHIAKFRLIRQKFFEY